MTSVCKLLIAKMKEVHIEIKISLTVMKSSSLNEAYSILTTFVIYMRLHYWILDTEDLV